MNTISAKRMIYPVKSEADLFGNTHMMNIYRGCNHGCIYCDSRSECYQGGRPTGDFGIVHAKENALFLIEQELQARKKTKPMTIGTGSMSDPYNNLEKESELTRGALRLFDKYKCGVLVITKSALVSRDTDLYSQIQTHSSVNVGITVTTVDPDICRKIEPAVSSSTERFQAIRKFADAEVFAGVHMNPILPYITDLKENIRQIIEKSAENGAKYVLCYGFGMTLRKGNREYYYENLEKHWPGLKEKYEKTYGEKYNCRCENAAELAAVFKEECENHGLLYKIEEINRAWKNEKKPEKQKCLFDFE